MQTVALDAEFLALSPPASTPAVLTLLVGTTEFPALPERYRLALTPHLTTFGSADDWEAAIVRCRALFVQRQPVHLCLLLSATAPEPVVPVAAYWLANLAYTAHHATLIPGIGVQHDEVHALTLELVRAS